ncbi:Hsp20 family protein [Paracoccus sp. J55]|uniref:Hsp20 family protein n=1 Tax=Paracoccus sp. J55 TaxID=935849 RepID=UPI00048CAFE3|nr:Hsp20 family protein [Paracoccus sp. J55]
MRTTFDFTPLFRSSVGFDRLLNSLEAAARAESADSWPPYDIVRADEDRYGITMAVAGFRESDLTLTQNGNVLVVAGKNESDDKAQYLHRGIPARSFERRFALADHVRVEGASLTDGLLEISLAREIPEEKKPRRIEIVHGTSAAALAKQARIPAAKTAEPQPETAAA